jgi:putative heme-binding domain-containing protein
MSRPPIIPIPTSRIPRRRPGLVRRVRILGIMGSVLLLLPTLPAQSAPPAVIGRAPSPSEVIAANVAVLGQGEIPAQQKAIATLGALPGPEVDRVLLALFERYRTGDLPVALWLEFFDAAARRDNPELKARLAEREKKLAASHDPLSPYRECLDGGDAAAGREIFTKRVEAGCVRCHSWNGEGGHIGPDLAPLHQVANRISILESIIDPNAVVAPGFQNILLTLKSGETVSGIMSFESDEQVIITSVVDGKKRTIPAQEITERTALPSPMPPGFGLILGKRAIRDLVEFLAASE